jgi:hypothetical protein
MGDDWVWGNHRGGGGAPLRSIDGGNVSNLRAVLRGSQQIDSSPSPTRKNKNNSSENYRDDGRSQNSVRTNDYPDDRYTSSPRKAKSTLRELNITDYERDEKIR